MLSTRNRRIIILLVFFIAGSVTLYHFQLRRLDDSSCVGLTEAQIIARLGNPSVRYSGTFGAPPVDFLAGHNNIETLQWNRLSGTLYISISDETGSKICFEAAWLPRGAVF